MKPFRDSDSWVSTLTVSRGTLQRRKGFVFNTITLDICSDNTYLYKSLIYKGITMSLKAKWIVGALVIQMLLVIKLCIGIMLEPINIPNSDEPQVVEKHDYSKYIKPTTNAVKKHITKKAIHKTKKKVKVKVIATMYNPVKDQCDSDPLITAGNYKINYKKASKHKWIAVSRDLLEYWGGRLKWGDKVRIKGAGHKNGIYTVVDTMNPRFTKRIDILETVGTPWYKFDNVTLEKV